jgi:hypothetical protein
MVSFNKNIKAVRSLAMAFQNLFKIYPLMKKGFLTNKYTLSVFILLAILGTDILLHKGMSRVILPKTFSAKREPQLNVPVCSQPLEIKGKRWKKAVNSLEAALTTDSTVNGIEMDVYFDTAQNNFLVYHDSSAVSSTTADEIFGALSNKKLSPSAWLDLKNLGQGNKEKALRHLSYLKNKYNLAGKLLVESSDVAALRTFCDSGFFTSYYVPFFNPYTDKEEQLEHTIDSMTLLLKTYPVSALSGYYFQVPFLKKYFPVFPLLTWTEDSKMSVVNKYFNYQLEKDSQVRIVLHDIDN